ncbi:MAG: amino acid-binding protein [Euryarchaeota archaeon]|nr:amino acid-binding protein [Euryarchaeota archaeon]
MWEEVDRHFEKFPGQRKVARFIFGRGFQVNEEGKVVSGRVEIPYSQIARELKIDRRVVESTAKRIAREKGLSEIFKNLKSIPFLRDIAPQLGLSVIIIVPDDAARPGIIGKVASKIADHGIAIRQAISDDPYFTENPRLTVITDGKVSGKLLEDIKKIEGVKGITIY